MIYQPHGGCEGNGAIMIVTCCGFITITS